MSDCPRTMTREEMEEGLRAGRKLRVDRRDSPELLDLQDMLDEGLITATLVEVDEQYSYFEFEWKQTL
jgi:hypothetical protein